MRAIAAWTLAWLALWAAVAHHVPRTPAIPDVALNNAVAAERMREDGLAGRTVLIGSSLIGQLPVARFDAGALNLGLSAYGAATGIRLVERQASLPAVAVIEINELAAPPDTLYADSLFAAAPGAPFVRRALGGLRLARFEFRPSTQAIAVAVRLSRRLRALQRESAKRRAERRFAESWATSYADTARARAALRWTAARLRDWQRRGVRVVLLDVPMHDAVLASDDARAARLVIDSELPPAAFDRVTLGAGPWRTSDARHLEANDATEAARRLVAALARP